MAANNALAIVRNEPVGPMAVFDPQAHAAYLDEKRDLIKRLCIPEKFHRNEALFDTFLEIAKLRGLNPIVKQMWCIPRGEKPSIETSIDGLRLIASRTREYAGSDPPIFDTEEADYPNKASVTVYRIVRGERCAFTGIAFWAEYGKALRAAPYDNLWKTKPYHMLAKVAEAGALRKAFPEETSGLYVEEEMQASAFDGQEDQAREVRAGAVPVSVPRPPAGGSSRRQMREMAARMETPERPMKATVTPASAPEAHAEGEPDEPAPIERDALLAELSDLAAHGFDLDRYVQRTHPDTDLSELTAAELAMAADVGRRVAKK